MKIRTVLRCGLLVATGAACRDDHDRAPAVEQAKDQVNAARGDVARETGDVAHASGDLARAEADFAARRDEALVALRQRYRMYVVEGAMARGLLADPRLSAGDRAEATDRVMRLERELGEAQQAVDSLATATADQWDAARTTVENAFSQLSGAATDAFHALSVDRIH
jgi:hypothetical protein